MEKVHHQRSHPIHCRVLDEITPKAMNGVCVASGMARSCERQVLMAAPAGIDGVDEDVIQEVLDSHRETLTTELDELLKHNDEEDPNNNEEPKKVGLTMKILANLLSKVISACQLIQENDRQLERHISVSRGLKKSLSCYVQMMDGLKNATSQSTMEHLKKNFRQCNPPARANHVQSAGHAIDLSYNSNYR